MEDLIIKGKQDVNRSDIVEGKPKVTEKRRRFYVGREEKKAFVGLSSPRDKSVLDKKVIADGTATTQNNTNDREIKNQPEETFKVLRQRTEIFLKNRQ